MEIWLIAAVVVTAAVAVFSLLNRRRGEVIDAPRRANPISSTPTPAPSPVPAEAGDDDNPSAGDLLKTEGGDERLERLADWLETEASEELGVDVFEPGPTRRIADAARAVMPVILAQGRGVVDLPGLVVDAAGGRDFRREIDSAKLEYIVVSALSAGDLLKAEGGDEPLEHFADWLENEASEELGVDVFEPGPTRRIADAARAVMPVILAQGRGVVDLPGLAVDASGGRDFRREIDIAGLERAVADVGLLNVHELCAWRRDSPRVRALAAALDDQRFYDMPGDYETADGDAIRIVEAARQAVADIERTGRADIALLAIGQNDKGQPFDIRRSVDAQTLRTIVTEFEKNDA